jgi:hypothetical protein
MKRSRIPSLYAAANYYPMTNAFYIQHASETDKRLKRATLVTGQSHGVTAEDGVMDVMLERTAYFDDKKGMGEGVEDSKRTTFKFAFLVESAEASGGDTWEDKLLSPVAATVARHLNNPPVGFLSAVPSVVNKHWDRKSLIQLPLPCNVHLLNFRSHVRNNTVVPSEDSDKRGDDLEDVTALMVFHHEGLDRRFGCVPYTCGALVAANDADDKNASLHFPVKFQQEVQQTFKSLSRTSLTGIHDLNQTNFQNPKLGKLFEAMKITCDAMELCSYNVIFG